MNAKFEVTTKPVPVNCGKKGCKGILWSIDLSRLEYGLGHEGYECDTCHRRVKKVPEKP